MDITVHHSQKDHVVDEQTDRTSLDQQIRYTRVIARAKWVENPATTCRERHMFRVRIIANFSPDEMAAEAILEWWNTDKWQLIHQWCSDAPMACEEAMHSCAMEDFEESNFTEDCDRLIDIGWAIVCRNARLQTHWE